MKYIALGFIIIGCILRFLAYRKLRENWSFELRIPDKIITSGIYKFMRHPSYLGSIFILTGTAILSPIVAIVWLSIAFFIARIIEEEKYLNQYDEYIDYKKRVGIFFLKIKR